jgi:hypothetical protein
MCVCLCVCVCVCCNGFHSVSLEIKAYEKTMHHAYISSLVSTLHVFVCAAVPLDVADESEAYKDV